MKAALPANEAERLASLHEYRILDTLPEAAYDEITRLASVICATPIALITLVDDERQWFKSVLGLDLQQTPREVAFCAHAILEPDLVVVPDLAQDPRFADNPYVADGPRFRFYAGAPLVTPEGHSLGTLCVVDRQPRDLNEDQREALRALGRQVMAQLELRRHIRMLEEAVAVRARAEEQLRAQADVAVQYQAVLTELAKSRDTDLDSALRTITRVDAETLNVERVSAWFFTSDETDLVCHTLYTLGEDVYGGGMRLEGSELPNYFGALRERRVIAAHDAVRDPATAEFAQDYLEPLGITSMLDVPIWRHGEMLGVVCHEHTGPAREWTTAEQDFAASIADMVSLALEAAERKQAEEDLRRAQQEAQRMADRMQAVAAAAAGVIGARSQTDLRNVLEAACRDVVPFDAFFILAYDPGSHTFVGFGGHDAGVFSPPNLVPAAGTPGERVVRERRSLVTLRSTEAAAQGAELTGTGRRSESIIRAPIVRGDEVLGMLSVQSYTPDLYTSQDVEVIEAIASLASTALSNIDLLSERAAVETALREAEREAQSIADRMRAVASAAAGVVGADSLDALHEVLRDASRKVISFDAFTFGLYNPENDTLEYLAGYDQDVGTPADTISLKGVPSERVIRERRSLVLLSSQDPTGAGARLMGTGRRSESIIRSPILSGERVLGVLAVHSYTPELYAHQDVEVLETIASLAATAINNIGLARQRAEAEEALRKSEASYRAIFDSSNEGIYIHDADTGAVLDVNRRALEFHGYTREELSENGVDLLSTGAPPYDAQTALDHLRAAGTGERQVFEWQIRHRNGRVRWVEVLLQRAVIAGEDRIVANVRDIHDRKTAEAELQKAYAELERRVEERTIELRRSEEYFRTLIENTSDIITVLDRDGAMLYQSPSMQRSLGWTPEQLLGNNLFDRLHPDDVAGTRERLLEVVHNPGAVRTATFRYRHADGSWRMLEAIGQTVSSRSDTQGVVLNSRDITERQRGEEALRQAKEEAEAAREAAESANRAKSEFLSRMSHELRTPMNSILGFAQLLAKRDLPQDQRKALDHILKAGEHLLNLINEVLDIARIEANRQQLSLEPVRVRHALIEALSLIRPLAAQRHVHLPEELELDGDPYVRADRQRLAQVLLNLLSNSVKYNRPGGLVWLSCEVKQDAAGVDYLDIGIHDTGVGIAADKLDELFVPFARLGAEQTEVEGTGLGLALSKRLVEAMGGHISVESMPGKGTVFHLELDLTAPPFGRLGRAAAAIEPSRSPAAGGPATILYIEDNLANLALVEAILGERPVKLMPALQGQMGLDLAAEHRPDVILLDLHLPDMSGEDVLRKLRLITRTREIPVIIITADATDSSIQRLLDAGARAYITKPIDVDEFLGTLDAVFRDIAEG